MTRKISLKGAKTRAWKAVARFVKLRDADSAGMVKCCTCGVFMHWQDRNCNAGHFVCGRNNTVLLDDRIIHPQCAKCNCAGGGEQYLYSVFMKERYGYSDADLEELNNLKFRTKKMTAHEVLDIAKTYEEENERLGREKGLCI